MAGLSIAQSHPLSSLLLVPMNIRGTEVKAVIDTWSTYTLMQQSLWRQLGEDKSSVVSSTPQHFLMADGNVHQAVRQSPVNYQWHDKRCTVGTYIMKDTHLAFPLIVGLDFLRVAGAILDMGKGRYGLESEKGLTYYLFLSSSTILAPSVTLKDANTNPSAAVTLYSALPPAWQPSNTTLSLDVVPSWDTDNHEELWKLMSTWPHATSNVLGKTSVEQYKILLSEVMPKRSRAYRVSPMKKRSLKNRLTKCLKIALLNLPSLCGPPP